MNEGAWLVAGYSAAIVAASLAGGALPSYARLGPRSASIALSLVAGLLLGVALNHLLPHALQLVETDAVETVLGWTLLGVVLMLLLVRFDFHRHDFDEAAPAAGFPQLGRAWAGLALGLGLHTAIEGVALGISVRAAAHGVGHGETAAGLPAAAGFAVFLAILLHKPLDALAVVGAMRLAGFRQAARSAANLAFALVLPLAALAAFWGVGQIGGGRADGVMGRALAVSGGAFLCISLLPQVHLHRQGRVWLSVAFLAGIAVALGLHRLAHGGAGGWGML